jgi:uncharacterized membrane protein YfcA
VAWLLVGFLVTAALYASVGFGGGSTYSALLVVAGTDYRLIPVISLLCNLAVVSGGSLTFRKRGWLDSRLAFPLAATSVPFAWLGGATPIGRDSFLAILGGMLVAAGLLLLRPEAPETPSPEATYRPRPLLAPLLGAGFGYAAGLVGIGGGIFLAPALHLSRMAPARTIAATTSVFILLNSLAGLAGQAYKLRGTGLPGEAVPYLMLLPAVLIGGRIGSLAGASVLPATLLRRVTGLLIVLVGGRLLLAWWSLGSAAAE